MKYPYLNRCITLIGDGNKSIAARRIKVSRNTLHTWLREGMPAKKARIDRVRAVALAAAKRKGVPKDEVPSFEQLLCEAAS